MGSGAFLVEACRQLGDALLKAWTAHGKLPLVPEDETPELFAQRTVAQRCLYGVDKNPMAVDLSKLSLWLATLAKDHPFTFLDHNLKCGDSLVGLTAKQIRMFHWAPVEKTQGIFGQEKFRDKIDLATRYRWVILESGDQSPDLLKEQQLKLAEEAIRPVRLAGNLAVAAFFAADKDKKRLEKRGEYLEKYNEFLKTGLHRPNAEETALWQGPHPVRPFHWEIEFPEVFQGTDGGFHCIVGNPPFMGGTLLSASLGSSYLEWLKATYEDAGDRADLVAYFFRRAFTLLRTNGTLGLIATNTIAQGDTRHTGLRWLCLHNGVVYNAYRRYRWPGLAAVVVSVIHVAKRPDQDKSTDSQFDIRPILDDRIVDIITAFLFHAGGHSTPLALFSNKGISFRGHDLYGMGFTFDDSVADGVTSPIAIMHQLIDRTPQNAERIFPFIGGEELNSDPRHCHHRYAIDLSDCDEQQAREHWPELMQVLEQKVRPERLKTRDNPDGKRLKESWWKYNRPRPELRAAIRNLPRVLVNSQVSAHHAFAFLPSTMIYAHTLNLFSFSTDSAFSVLQSRIHEVWSRFFASSMKDDLRYTISDCFETFPFPEGILEAGSRESGVGSRAEPHAPESSDPSSLLPIPNSLLPLEQAGKEYYEFRAELMVRNNEGLTKTYNRFHDPNEPSADIVRLRELHAVMDRAVLDAYGGDLAKLSVPPCEFLLDYSEEEEEGNRESGVGMRDDQAPDSSFPIPYSRLPTPLSPLALPTPSRRKKPWRFRWPDAFRDEVLALLLELNKQRAEQERLAAPVEKTKRAPRAKRTDKKPDTTEPPPSEPGLYDAHE